jgi:hypothetical protein
MGVTIIGILATLFTTIVGIVAVANAVRASKIKHGKKEEQLSFDLRSRAHA